MKKKSKTKIIIFMLMTFCISIGYAAINRTLVINGNSEVKQNTWDLHFENIQIKNGSVEAAKEPTLDNTKLSIDFSFNLNLPGEFYEFTVDIKNAGTIDAMIDNVTKTPNLTEEQKKYINYIIEYENGEQITSKQLIKANFKTRIKVRVEYRSDITENELPSSNDNLNLGFSLNYVQSDNTGNQVKDNGAAIIANGPVDEIGTIVTIGTEQFYIYGTDEENIKLISMYNLYVGNQCTYSNESSCISYGEEATGMQDSTMLGYLIKNKGRNGTLYFEKNIIEEHIDYYENLLEEKYRIDIVESRLINRNESENISFTLCDSNNKCIYQPYWIHNTSYWIDNGLCMHNEYGAIKNIGNSKNNCGVRPIIIIPKTSILEIIDEKAKQSIEVKINNTTYYYFPRMRWKDWIGTEFDTINFVLSSTYPDYIEITNNSNQCLHNGTSFVYEYELIDSSINYSIQKCPGSNEPV